MGMTSATCSGVVDQVVDGFPAQRRQRQQADVVTQSHRQLGLADRMGRVAHQSGDQDGRLAAGAASAAVWAANSSTGR